MKPSRTWHCLIFVLCTAFLAAAPPDADSNNSSGSICQSGLDCSHVPVIQSAQGIVYNTGGAIAYLNSMTGKPFWSYSPTKGRVSSNIVTLGDLLFFAGNTAGPCGPIYAVEATTRKIAWSDSYSSCRLWTDGRLLYLQGSSGDGVRALVPTTGGEVWHAEDETPEFVQTLVIQSSRIYTNDRILNAETGQTIRWLSKHTYLLNILPTRDILFTSSTGGSLDAINISDGSERWHSDPLEGYELNAIRASDQIVYATTYEGSATGARNGILRAFQSDNGRLRWSYSLHSCCQNLDYSPIAEMGGTLFLLTPVNARSGTKLIALDGHTGKLLWSYHSEVTLNGPPAVEGGHLYLTTSKGELVAMDPATGKSIWKYEP